MFVVWSLPKLSLRSNVTMYEGRYQAVVSYSQPRKLDGKHSPDNSLTSTSFRLAHYRYVYTGAGRVFSSSGRHTCTGSDRTSMLKIEA